MYVWCDALVNYISALGYGASGNSSSGEDLFKKFWPANVHIVGKEITRFHDAIWPAMLLSAGLELPKTIFVHGFILSGGKKMSKSLGNVIDPQNLIAEYGAEALRYYFAREISPFEDGELTVETFKNAYNANLANGLGNLVSRVMKMAVSNGIKYEAGWPIPGENSHDVLEKKYTEALETYNIKAAADAVWEVVAYMDRSIQNKQPFKKIKENPEEAKKDIQFLLHGLALISRLLKPILPGTAVSIEECIRTNTTPAEALFPRKE
jgi:methionyl-tRNA synthetase